MKDFHRLVLAFPLSMAVSIAVGDIAVAVLHARGYTETITVKMVGGGSVSYVPMTQAEYYVGPYLQIPILLIVFIAVAYWPAIHEHTAVLRS